MEQTIQVRSHFHYFRIPSSRREGTVFRIRRATPPKWAPLPYRDMTTTINSAPETFSSRKSRVSVPVLGVGDKIGGGDTYVVENVLPPELAEFAFENLMKSRGTSCIIEVRQPSFRPSLTRHRILTHTTPPIGGEVPRLVALEGEIDASGK